MSYVSNVLFEIQKMGNVVRQSFTQLKVRRDRDAISRTECHDFDVIKRIWQVVEMNSPYYGFAFSTILFKNHPQYVKYFEEEAIPEFVQEAKLKKKFAVIYDIVCALFVDYQDKPVQRDYLLGYIAMVHKDMGLTLKDFEYFMSDLLETLIVELPHIMTEEYILIQKKYLNDLIQTLMNLMDQHRKRIEHVQQRRRTLLKKCCPWLHDPESQIIYGFPLKYWLYKKRYWEYRRLIWASIEVDTLARSVSSSMFDKRKKLFARRKSMEIRRIDIKEQTKTESTDKRISSDSDTLSEGASRRGSRRGRRRSSKVRKLIRSERDRKKKAYRPRATSSGFSPMETIHEHDKATARTSPPRNVDSHLPISTALHSSCSELQEGESKVASILPGNTARRRRRESKVLRIVAL